MKILHIHPSMAGGGIEAMVCGLANEMAKTEEVTVCSIFEPNDDDIFWNRLSDGVNRISLGKSKAGFSLSEVFKIYRLLRKGGFDVVNLHGFFYYYAFSILLLHHKVKFFYTVHSDANMENWGWEKRVFRIKKCFFRWRWLNPITISHASKDSFTQLYGINSQLIYNGIPCPKFSAKDLVKEYRKTPNTKIFIHAGRISKEKNQVALCRVFKSLIEQGEDVALLIAGSIQDRRIYESVEGYLGERIFYLGERDDIPQLMYNSDAMCLPSIWEGLPVTLLEALSVGCIPICSPVGGIPNVVVDGVNGFLSESSNEDDYGKTVRQFLLLTEKDLNLIKENCKQSFSKYDIINTSKKYLKYYESN